jgi:hypothetical protein
MLLFSGGRSSALPRSRDPGAWLAKAQSAAQSTARTAQSAAKSVDPVAAFEQAKSDVADVARHVRDTAPDLADDLSAKPAEIRKAVMDALPMRRRRRSRWPFLLLAALGIAAAATLIAQLAMRRRLMLPERLEDRWQPSMTGSGSMLTHPPTGVAPDVTSRPETLDRDAALRAADEGMEPSGHAIEPRSLGAAATTRIGSELPFEPSLEDSPAVDHAQGTH